MLHWYYLLVPCVMVALYALGRRSVILKDGVPEHVLDNMAAALISLAAGGLSSSLVVGGSYDYVTQDIYKMSGSIWARAAGACIWLMVVALVACGVLAVLMWVCLQIGQEAKTKALQKQVSFDTE